MKVVVHYDLSIGGHVHELNERGYGVSIDWYPNGECSASVLQHSPKGCWDVVWIEGNITDLDAALQRAIAKLVLKQ